MPHLTDAARLLTEEINARVAALEVEIQERHEAVARLRAVAEVLETLPLWGGQSQSVTESCLVVRDDEFGHLTMAQAAAEVLRRAGKPMHARDLWFAIMRGGYPHHGRSSLQSLVTCLHRLKSRFRRVGPNVFALADAGSLGELQNVPAMESCNAHQESVHQAVR